MAASHLAVERLDFDTAIRMLGETHPIVFDLYDVTPSSPVTSFPSHLTLTLMVVYLSFPYLFDLEHFFLPYLLPYYLSESLPSPPFSRPFFHACPITYSISLYSYSSSLAHPPSLTLTCPSSSILSLSRLYSLTHLSTDKITADSPTYTKAQIIKVRCWVIDLPRKRYLLDD